MMMLCFSLLITLLVFSSSYYLAYSHQLRSNIQSTAFNFRLVSQTIERDLIEVSALANWCSFGSNPPARFLATGSDPVAAVRSHTRLQEEHRNNRASTYIKRILVINKPATAMLHISTVNSNQKLIYLNENSLLPISGYDLYETAHFYDITVDPYAQTPYSVINILAPVYAPASSQVSGVVYLAVDTAVISDSLKGYIPLDGAKLYLTLDSHVYHIDGRTFSPVEGLGTIIYETAADSSEEDIMIGKLQDAAGQMSNVVSCHIRNGMTLTQVFDQSQIMPSTESWVFLALSICLLISLLSVVIILTMNHTISRPISYIRKKMDAIATGDFSFDPTIESNSEIGVVGKGINKLAYDVQELMEKRLADEQQKRELEYRMLQSQINPHFLYNALSSIKMMATLQKADGIAEMTTSLAHLLKTAAKDLRKIVPLRDEIALLDDYFIILKYRYGGTVSFKKNIEDEKLLDCELPRFVLQPLMENAIFHGIEPKGHGNIKLNVSGCINGVCVSLWDDGVGIPPDILKELVDDMESVTLSESYTSIGMRSVHHRIRSVFGKNYGLIVESEKGIYTKMTLRIPYSLHRNEKIIADGLEKKNV
jgi:two-component system sensor histidine kinase YesM